ncbi:MAG: protein translocase subunit SecD [Proteobacteria bacterium]|nr:protein translocase subunit SecD [Pseudomonadota bacterium]
MDRKIRWRTFWLALLIVLAVFTLIPTWVPSEKLPRWFNSVFDKKVQLGLDLQGGLYIVYSIDLNKAVDDKASDLKRNIEEEMRQQSIKGKVSTPAQPIGAVTIRLENATEKAKIDSKFLSAWDSVIDPSYECPDGKQETVVCLRVSTDYADGIRDAALQQAIATIRDRINERGVSEPSVKQKGGQIIVELPGLDKEETQRVRDIIARTAQLSFKMVDNSSDGQFNDQNGSEYMRLIYRQVNGESGEKADPRAEEMGIKAQIDIWYHDEKGKFQDYYLTASDYEQSFTIAEAKKRGCWNRNLREYQGTVKCLVKGSSRIQDYLDELAAKDAKFKLDDDHQITFERVQPRSLDLEEQTEPYWRSYYLTRPVELGGKEVSEAIVQWDPQTNRPAVLVSFNRYGGRRFEDMTGANVGRKMAIILDEKVISAPVIQTRIGGGASQITMGGGTNDEILKEAENLVSGLKTGSLPAPLQEESSNSVGPLLGMDAVDKGVVSFLVGSVLVVVIMSFIYRFAGVISIFAVVLNLTFMMAILAAFGATLTLPGIAALVLTVGMAVDASIIIYERIREELRAGKSIRGAVDAGFSRGFAAIFDGQLTTAVAGYVLMQYGSGPIRGFAVMLLIGIVCTLFTATWCTRLFFELYVGKGRKVKQIAI